jgi:hypothetical protein
MQNNSEVFNDHSAPHKEGGHGKWMAIHGILMLGMLLPMIAAAAPLGAATLGDGAVQAMHMVKDMITGLTSNFDVVADMVSNTMDGELAANTLDAGSMHGAAEAAGHGAHIGASAQLTQFDQWLSALSPQELAQIKEEASGVYGLSLKDYHQMNIMNHGLQ